MTVQQLVDFLRDFHPDTRIGIAGHFGEFHEMHLPYTRELDSERKGHDWRDTQIQPETFLLFDVPDIGEEPD